MSRIILYILTAIVISFRIYAQAPDTLWTKKIGGTGIDLANEIIQTSDGGFAVAGYTTSFNVVQRDAYAVRLDSLGNIIWQKTYGGNLLEQAYSIKQTHDGGFIISAFRYGVSSNLWLIKTNANGDTSWTRNIGYDGNEFGSNLQLTDDGGFLVVGYTDSDKISSGDRDVWLLKFDSTGNQLWERTFGGESTDEGLKLLKLNDGNLLVSGYSESFSGGDRDGWIVKTNSSGNFIWSTSFGGGSYDEFSATAEDEEGNLFFTGTTESSGDRNLWIVKTDSGGNHIFTKSYGGSQWEWGHDIKRTSDGNFIVTGFNQSNSTFLRQLWLLKIDEQGDTLWTKLFTSVNGSEGYSVIQTLDDGFAVTGSAGSAGTGTDVWIIRLKPEGTSAIEDNLSDVNRSFSLSQNFPNPFNPNTSLKYEIGSQQFVTLKIYDLLGREIAIIVNEEKPAGTYEVTFDASGLSSGIYFYRLQAGSFTETKKMILIR
ncbi:MAG TPA: T9SS type A sorting domain-containing protein [Ignavibacteriaceae bacterium]|nr:T9SS type A sorting domain-containing protein [Ignavibacteriaceae bacterium]